MRNITPHILQNVCTPGPGPFPPPPTNQLSDIKKTITKVPTAVSDTAGGSKLLAHELFTNDVLYAEAALDMSGLPAHLLPLVPLFCRSLTQVRGGVVVVLGGRHVCAAGGVCW